MPFISKEEITSVVIAGAGGFGSEVFDYINEETRNGGPKILGFIDDTPGGKTPDGVYLPWLGKIGDFVPKSGQAVVVAIGSTQGRRSILTNFWQRNIATPAYFHSSSIISPTAKLHRGVIICPFCIVNRDAVLEDGCVLNVHCSVGHGASVGSFSVLSPYAALNGDARVGSDCFLGTRATVYPKISIGDYCIVDSHTGVRVLATDRQMISSRGKYQIVAIR